MAPLSSQATMREQLGETLVSQETGVTKESDSEHFTRLCALTRRTLRDTKTATSADMFQMESRFKGLIEKARVLVQDDLADALEISYAGLKADVEERTPMEPGIKMATLPDQLQFLIRLSLPPAPATHTYASLVLDKAKDPFRIPSALTWETIMADEPFEGQHWEGMSKSKQTRKGKQRSRSWSSSADSQDDLTDDERLQSPFSSPPTTTASDEKRSQDAEEFVSPSELAMARAQMELDEMLDRQYWKENWRIDVDLDEPFDLARPSTLGPAVTRAAGGVDGAALRLAGPSRGNYIHEVDAVREVLLALQGLNNNLLLLHPPVSATDSSAVKIRPSVPNVVHLTSSSYHSLLNTFASAASIPHRLEDFLQSVGCRNTIPSNAMGQGSCTAEAFAEAIDAQVRHFRSWSAAKEQALCAAQAGIGPSLAVSLLSLSAEVDRETVVLKLLLDIVQVVQKQLPDNDQGLDVFVDHSLGMPIHALSSILLDELFSAYKAQYNMGNDDNSRSLFQIFLASAQPTWTATVSWLEDGKIGELQHQEDGVVYVDSGDFFISQDAEVPMTDSSYWSSAYTLRPLRTQDDRSSIPAFLQHMSGDILAGGKAQGLLYALGQVTITSDRLSTGLSGLVATSQDELSDPRDFEALVADCLSPHCLGSQRLLQTVLVDTCRMWEHLAAIENLCLFRRGDIMGDFSNDLFDRLETRHAWYDFHVLNATFRDIIAARPEARIDASLVRFWYSRSKEDAAARLTRCLAGLSVEYQVPFPLLYLFTPESLQKYSAIFVFLLQTRRSKRVIDQILVRRGLQQQLSLLEEHAADDMKNFFALRSKLSWFLNTITYFISITVIQSRLQDFHKDLKAARTLDDMIKVHETHLERLISRCLLSESTSSLHKTVVYALDIALYFGDCYTALSGDATLNIPRRTFDTRDKKHTRTRRQRRMLRKQDLVGFSENLPALADDESSDSDEEAVPDHSIAEQTMSIGASISFEEESFSARIDRMSNEMDRLVRHLRRGAEKIASEGGLDSSTFEVLAFVLEGWDL